jgi:MarR family 2-MHQ and catechol resistance regulon transcriptional repressor
MGTRHKGSPAEVRALNTFIKLTRAAESTESRLAGLLTEANLTDSQFGVLEALYHLGPMHQCDLATKLLRSSGNITLVLDNLEKRKLVRRQRGTEDRRYITVHLTPEGERLIREVFPRHAANIVQVMNVLTPDEQEELARLCRKLGLQERG